MRTVPFVNFSSLVRKQIHVAALNRRLTNKGGKADFEGHKRIFQIAITTTKALGLMSHSSLYNCIVLDLHF